MVNYSAMNSTQLKLKEFVNRENIKLGKPSGKYGTTTKVGLLKMITSWRL